MDIFQIKPFVPIYLLQYSLKDVNCMLVQSVTSVHTVSYGYIQNQALCSYLFDPIWLEGRQFHASPISWHILHKLHKSIVKNAR